MLGKEELKPALPSLERKHRKDTCKKEERATVGVG